MKPLSKYVTEALSAYQFQVVKFKPKSQSIEMIQQILADKDIDSKVIDNVLYVIDKNDQRMAKLLLRRSDIDTDELFDL